MKNSKGFTLIELLVVIAIIALLLSIIMPSLGLAKEKAKNLACRSNVRQLALALRLYTEQNDGRLFGYGDDLFLNYLSGELGSLDKVRYCPSTKIDETNTGTSWGNARENWSWNLPSGPEHGSYGLNGWLYYSDTDRHELGGGYVVVDVPDYRSNVYTNTLEASSSASVPVFTDAVWVDLWPHHTDQMPRLYNLHRDSTEYTGIDNPPRGHILRAMVDRHKGSANVSFLDGHVEGIKLNKMWSLKWHKTFVPFSGDKLRDDNATPIYK